ncbi:hypothetical protein PSH77_14930 [Pseudomonas extremorientalis]|uniref:phage tail fiber protein n=1 Tax=Pseudomonas extremorientalis TaxID=169669 RepID=UPI002734F8C7|nr:hypothetical protein [Pseudomonas extremorientalis]WLG53994.1 hypothetical protein PSH77_14930 [Pseudomonas extremorientalis]
MVWQRVGTVSVQNGSTTVTGVNVDFDATSRVGDSFIGPDGSNYEVSNVVSATVISILPAYKGATVSGAAYAIMPVQGYDKMLSDAFNALNNQFGQKLAALGTTGNYEILPLNKGGTGSDNQPGARSALGLTSMAVASFGYENGNVADSYMVGRTKSSVAQSWYTNTGHGLDPNLYPPGSSGMPTGGTGYWYKYVFRHADTANRLTIAWPYGLTGSSGTVKFQSIYDGATTPWIELYHTGNTTRGSGGALSAASPILRIANVEESQRRDLNEQTFEPAGAWGVANNEARGVSVERLAIGEYRVIGSLGLAIEGWRTHDPSSPDGGRMLGITDTQQLDDGTVIVRLFKQRWTLTEDGEMVPGRGAPIDVPLNSWIDVRLEMQKVESPPPVTTVEA